VSVVGEPDAMTGGVTGGGATAGRVSRGGMASGGATCGGVASGLVTRVGMASGGAN